MNNEYDDYLVISSVEDGPVYVTFDGTEPGPENGHVLHDMDRTTFSAKTFHQHRASGGYIRRLEPVLNRIMQWL